MIGCYEVFAAARLLGLARDTPVQDNGMLVPVFSQPHGPAYEYEQPSIRNIALHPLLRDPWEEDRCEVSPKVP